MVLLERGTKFTKYIGNADPTSISIALIALKYENPRMHAMYNRVQQNEDSPKTIADKFSISITTLQQRISQARRFLYDHIHLQQNKPLLYQAYDMHIRQGISKTEVGEQLGVSLKSVGIRIAYAKKFLRGGAPLTSKKISSIDSIDSTDKRKTKSLDDLIASVGITPSEQSRYDKATKIIEELKEIYPKLYDTVKTELIDGSSRDETMKKFGLTSSSAVSKRLQRARTYLEERLAGKPKPSEEELARKRKPGRKKSISTTHTSSNSVNPGWNTRNQTYENATKNPNNGVSSKLRISEIWKQHKARPTDESRNYLIEHYIDIVKHTAERMHIRFPREVDVEDLMSAGFFGLMDAIDSFDSERGVKFEIYCTQRIRGAIYDELRVMDWVPRLVRNRTARVDRARRTLEMRLGRKVEDSEIQRELQLGIVEMNKLKRDSKPIATVSLNRKWFENDNGKEETEGDNIVDSRAENPLSEILKKDFNLSLTKNFSRREKLLITLYYYEEMTMKDIGEILKISESRVSQIHGSIIERLKAQYQHRKDEITEPVHTY